MWWKGEYVSNQEYQGSDGAVDGGDLNGHVHTIEEMKAWLNPFGYSDAINDAAINFILREFVMSKVSCDEMRNMDLIVELLRPQLEVTKEYNNTSKHLPSYIKHLTGGRLLSRLS